MARKKPPKQVAAPTPRGVSWFQHGAPAAVFLLYAVLAKTAPALVPQLAQEDSWVEWLTVAAFGSAGVAYGLIALHRGFRDGWFAGGLGLFCLFVAGEEVSWGQRLVGFVPPKIFLEKNYQEEANLHNLLTQYMQTKWMVVFILAAWGLALPVFRRNGMGRLFERFKVIEPPLALTPWCIIGILLLVTYPIEMTAEYVELATGLIFLGTAIPFLQLGRRTYAALSAPLLAVIAAVFYQNLQDSFGSPQKRACAEAETRILAAAIEEGSGLPGLFARQRVDRRVYTSIQRGELKPEILRSLDAVVCDDVSKDPDRRLYALDPWGQPYWIYFERDPGQRTGTALFYSFGPDRRYDSPMGKIEGTDDVGARSRPLDLGTGRP